MSFYRILKSFINEALYFVIDNKQVKTGLPKYKTNTKKKELKLLLRNFTCLKNLINSAQVTLPSLSTSAGAKYAFHIDFKFAFSLLP